MVRIIENWVRVKGSIIENVRSNTDAEFDIIRVQLLDIENYLQYPNLISQLNSTVISINITSSTVNALKLLPGRIISGLLRVAGNQQFFFAEDSIVIN